MSEEEEINQVPHIAKLEPGEKFIVNIPICCQEGWDDCEYAVQKPRKEKVNIGL